MDIAGIVSGSSRQGCGGDRQWSVASSGSATVRCQRRERSSEAATCKSARNVGAIAAGWRSTSDEGRDACQVDPGSLQGDALPYSNRVAGTSGRSRHRGRTRHDLAVLRAARDHAQKKTARATEQDRPDNVKRREEWLDSQLDLDPKQLIFSDETWASTNMARRYSSASRGERLRASVPHGHWKTTTFVAGLSRMR